MIKIKPIFIIILFSSIYFFFSWAYSFFLYDEDLLSKIIHESTHSGDGALYYPFIKYLSIFDLNNSYDPNVNNLKNISLPYGSLFIHSIFFKIFGLHGLIIVDYFAIILFMTIFYKIFKLYFNDRVSILASLFLFTVPILINIFSLEDLKYLQVISSNIFTIRAHRPVFSSLIFYSFVLIIFLIHHQQKKMFSKKYFSMLGFLSGISFVGFYYYAVIEFIFLFMYLVYKYKKKLVATLIQNKIACFYFILFFFLITLPFLINHLFLTEDDFLIRNGAFELTKEKKIILLNYYLSKYLQIKILFIIFLSIVILFYIKKFNKKKYSLLVIFFLLFTSSLIAPVAFIIISSKAALLYHFNNMMLVTIFLFFYCFIFLLKEYLYKIFDNKIFYIFALILLTGINIFGSFDKQLNAYKNEDNNNRRQEFNKVINEIKLSKINLKNSSILTFDNHFLVWLILNDAKYLNLNNQLFSAKTDLMIENDLIQNFKFLNLDSEHFYKFFENKKTKWRIINYNVPVFFYFKYAANSINTFNDSTDFDENFFDVIKNTSPILQQQFAIPKAEFKRLNDKFNKSTFSKNYRVPDLIILKKEDFVYQYMNNNINNFCTLFDGKFYIVYTSLVNKNLCHRDKKL